MCRPLKSGLEYFPLDTDVLENRKVQRLLRKYGCEGFAVYSAVLCDIYRHEGYYVRYDGAYCRDIAFVLNLPEENPGLVGEVIGYCISLELFDAELAARENILTSVGIQTRYREVRKRYKVSMRNEFLLPAGTEAPAALPGKPVEPGAREEKKTKAPFRSAGQRSVNATELPLPVTGSGAGSPVTGTSGTTQVRIGVTETGPVPERAYHRTETGCSVQATEGGEAGEWPAACPAGMPAGATGSGAYGGVPGIAAVKPPVRTETQTAGATDTAVYPTGIPGYKTETPHGAPETAFPLHREPSKFEATPSDNVAETPCFVSETPDNLSETLLCITEIPDNVATLSDNIPETAFPLHREPPKFEATPSVNVAETPCFVPETPDNLSETLLCITEIPDNVATLSDNIPETAFPLHREPPKFEATPSVNVPETPVNVTETPVCVAETPTKEKENKKERKEKIEERVVKYYNFRLSGKLPAVARLTPGRVRAVRARVSEYGEAGVMRMLDAAAGSAFLLGENPRRWRADFDWLFKPANFVKVWEGNYINSHGNDTHSGSNRHAGERKREILRMAAEAASRDCIAR